LTITPKKILLIRTDRIGDVILTLPIADTLKFNYPEAEIDILVNKRVAELILDYPNINKVHAIEKETISGIRRICNKGNYDIVIVVRPVFNAALAVWLSRVKLRLGSGYRWYSFLFNIKHYRHRKYSEQHELEYNLLNEIGCKRLDKVKPQIVHNPQAKLEMRKKLNEHHIPLDKPFIIIHPGSLGSALTWKTDNFIELADKITSSIDLDFNIFITGSISEKDLLNKFKSNIHHSEKIFLIYFLNLKEIAELIRKAKLFISNSTGTIHIAAAVNTFTIGFFSPITAENKTRWAPYTEKKKIYSPAEYTGDDSMDSIEMDEVFAFVKKYLQSFDIPPSSNN
jgi:heptosyltransferase-3